MAIRNPYKRMPRNEPLVNAIELSPLHDHEEFTEVETEVVCACEDESDCEVKSDHREHSGDDEVDHIKKELQFDLNHPLKHALRSVFKNGGKVLLAFPGSSIAQLEEVAEDIRKEFVPEQRSFPPWLKRYNHPYVSIIDASNQRFPDIDVRVIQIITTSVDQYSSIIREKIQQTIQSDPDIDLVKLVNAETLTEVLTVNPDPNKGNVYFKHVTRPQELDDTSLYFRMRFQPHRDDTRVTRPVIIWINLKTLLPIAKTDNDELYAVLPQEEVIYPSCAFDSAVENDIPHTIAQPFYWLPAVVNGSSHQSIYFYRQHGTDESSAIYPATEQEPTRRISKGRNNVAVIRVSQMQFVVRHIKTDAN